MNSVGRYILACLLTLLPLLRVSAGDDNKREFRAAWIATIYGLDWPKKPATDASSLKAQKKELTEMLDRLKSAGLNAVMFQVRTFSDAMYRSNLEPWAAPLSGTRGTPPPGNWDPLEFCIAEAHSRGMECHAWVNPFRYSTSNRPYADKYDKNLRPLLISFTEKPKSRRDKAKTTVILDPGNPKARKHVVDVCRDIVSRYDIDGLVFDDYFYPDHLPLGNGYDFNEWKKSGTKLSQADWRRENVNTVIAAVYEMIQEVKPYVVFGVSPAGVAGGNGESSSRHGLPLSPGNDWMFGRLFCDPLAWMEAGNVDYISPQIYWARDHKTNPYEPLAHWWGIASEKLGCRLYPSHSLSGFATNEGDNPSAWNERIAQIEIDRAEAPFETPGSILYAARNINGFGRELGAGIYKYQAIPPAFLYKESTDPGAVSSLRLDGDKLSWDAPRPGLRYAVYSIPDDIEIIDAISLTHGGISAEYLLGITYTTSFTIAGSKSRRIGVAPLDRYGHEWEVTFL